MAGKALTAADRLAVMSRIVAAMFGGYAFANAAGVFFAHVLPMPRASAVMTMTLASFALYAAAAIWVFAARTATLAWLGLLAPTLLLGAAAWWLGAFA